MPVLTLCVLYKDLFQLYPDNFQNNYFLLSDKLEHITVFYLFDIASCMVFDVVVCMQRLF